MLHRTWLHCSAGALLCLLAPLALRADLLRSLNFQMANAASGRVEPPVLFTLFATISPSLGRPLPPPCAFGPFQPAAGKPCFSLLQENLTTNDIGRSFLIDASTNSDFATIASLLGSETQLELWDYTYPAGIVPALPASSAPPGWLTGGGGGTYTPGFPNAEITQLRFTITSLCVSNNGSCMGVPGLLEDDRLSAKLDVYGVAVPEPMSVLLVAPALLLLFAKHFRRTN